MPEMINTFPPDGNEVTIRFDNPDAALFFKTWLCDMGEQDYWEWMKYREREVADDGITAVRFNYHDPGRGVVIAECGRLDREDP